MLFLAYIGDIAEGPGGRGGGHRLRWGRQREKYSRVSYPRGCLPYHDDDDGNDNGDGDGCGHNVVMAFVKVVEQSKHLKGRHNMRK